MKKIAPVIGVDIGGVLISRSDERTDTSFFGKNYLESIEVEGAFNALKSLGNSGFEVHLVSKCGDEIQRKTRNWLSHHDFYKRTGVNESNIWFCKARNEKAAICANIGATHFVDDRLEVLSYLTNVSNLFLFDATEKEVRKFQHALPMVTRVSTWSELLANLPVETGKEVGLFCSK